MPPVLAPAGEAFGGACAWQLVEDREPVGFEAGVVALPEGRGGRQRQQMRQEIRRLVQKVDAQLVLGNADMDVQPANREPPPDPLQVVAQARIAAALGRLLRVPASKGMGCRGDRRQTIAGARSPYRRPQMPQIGESLVGSG